MKHALAKFYGTFTDVNQLEQAMLSVVDELQLQVLHQAFHTFDSQEVAGLLLLSESHFAIHTWPDRGYAMVDLLSPSASQGIQLLANILGAHFEMMEVDREMNYVSS